MLHGLGFEHDEAGGVVDGGVDGVLDAGRFFGFFGVVPAVQCADEVAGDAAEAFEFAFVEIFGVLIEVFFGDLVAGFVGDELGAGFDEAGNMESIVVVEVSEGLFYFLFGDFGVPFERSHEPFDVKILSV